ncbi:hypothetical protein D3C80_938010 [compost metagenome]
MPRPVAAIADPVQLHAEGLQVAYGWRVLGVPAQQAGGGEPKAAAGSSQSMQVIGMGPAEADDAARPDTSGDSQMLQQLEPLVATDQRVDEVQAQHCHFYPRPLKPGERKPLQGGIRQAVKGFGKGGRHGNKRFCARGAQFTSVAVPGLQAPPDIRLTIRQPGASPG